MSAEDALADVMNLLETEPAASSGLSPRPDIPALREQVAVLVSTGKAKKAIGVQLTHEDVNRLNDEEVEKYAKRYVGYVGSKTTDSLIDSFIFLATKVARMAIKIKDIEAYQKELRNDYILNKELSNLAGNVALKCTRFLAVGNAVFITAKHVDYSPQQDSAPRPGDVGWNPTQLPGRATLLVMKTAICLRALRTLRKYLAQQLQNKWSPFINKC